MASSQDLVSLTLRRITVGGQPAVLTITAESAARVVFWTGATPRPSHAGQRDVMVVSVSGAGISTPAPQGTSAFVVRSEVIAIWSEPGAACPYFHATLWSSGPDAPTVEAELLRIVASMPLTARASAMPASMLMLPESDAWTRIRALFPTGPIARPTWLPPEVDRSQVELRRLAVTPTREYEIVYRDAAGADLITFRLGPVAKVNGSGVGFCCVRAARSILSFDSGLFSDPTRPGLRQMEWQEQTRTLSFRSERIKGEDMLRIAWALDRTTAPPNPYPDARSKVGACSSAMNADDTILRLLALSGRKDREAVLDCYALDKIIVDGTGLGAWADLPLTRSARIDRRADIAGRVELQVTWDFASDPGGAWGPQATRFFLLGLDDGRWRVYEIATAPFGRPP